MPRAGGVGTSLTCQQDKGSPTITSPEEGKNHRGSSSFLQKAPLSRSHLIYFQFTATPRRNDASSGLRAPIPPKLPFWPAFALPQLDRNPTPPSTCPSSPAPVCFHSPFRPLLGSHHRDLFLFTLTSCQLLTPPPPCPPLQQLQAALK